MRPAGCPHEDAVARGAAGEGWDRDPHRDHARGCPICRRAVLVAASLRRLAEVDRALTTALPDSGAIVLRARLVERFEEERRAAVRSARPVAWMDAALLASGLGLLAWLTHRAAEMAPALRIPISLLPEEANVVALVAGAGLLILVATVRALWAES